MVFVSFFGPDVRFFNLFYIRDEACSNGVSFEVSEKGDPLSQPTRRFVYIQHNTQHDTTHAQQQTTLQHTTHAPLHTVTATASMSVAEKRDMLKFMSPSNRLLANEEAKKKQEELVKSISPPFCLFFSY